MLQLNEVTINTKGLSGNQLQLLVKNFDKPEELQSYITEINAIKTASNGIFNEDVALSYAVAIEGLESKQAALLLSTQGLTNAQIAETLAVNESNVARNYQAMADAGLLARKQQLTVAEIQENLQTVLGAEADTSAAMSSLGLSAAIEGQEHQTVQLTAKKLQELVVTHALTEAQAQELAMRTGVIFSMKTQTASILPKWIATLKACTLAIWDQVKATATWLVTTPAGWAAIAIGSIAAVTAIIWKLHDALTVTLEEQKETLNKAKEAYEDVKNELHGLETEIQNNIDRIKELEALSDITWLEQEELDRLREVTKELELQKKLKQEETLQAAEIVYKENKAAIDKEFDDLPANSLVDQELKQRLSSGNIGVAQLDLKDGISDMATALQYLNEESLLIRKTLKNMMLLLVV